MISRLLPSDAGVSGDPIGQPRFDRLAAVHGHSDDFPFADLAEDMVTALYAFQRPTTRGQSLAKFLASNGPHTASSRI